MCCPVFEVEGLRFAYCKQIQIAELNSDRSLVNIQRNESVLDRNVVHTESFPSHSIRIIFSEVVCVQALPPYTVSISLSFANFCSGRVYYSLVFLFSLSCFLFFPRPFSSEDELSQTTQAQVSGTRVCSTEQWSGGHKVRGWGEKGLDVKTAGGEGEHLR
jgi:hypothetical protein